MIEKMTDEEKRLMLFDMQEHPECYTDEQIETLLADDAIKDFFRDMAMTRMAQQKAEAKEVDVDEAWKTFAAKQGLADSSRRAKPLSPRLKIAASIAGVIFLSGVAFAAIHSGMFRSYSDTRQPEAEQEVPVADTLKTDTTKTETVEKADTLDLKPVVFENAELHEVVSQMAAFYHVKVEFANKDARHIRVFFNWDKKKTLQQNVDILNVFDRIQIENENGTLKVE